MKITVPLENNFLPDKFTKHADESHKLHNIPITSFPISIDEAPQNTKSYALTFLDYDAVPVAGFPWIHWIAANIPSRATLIPENNSQSPIIQMTQGNNSTAGKYISNTDERTKARYFGPTPPDGTHTYELTVYALDTNLDLTDGFWLNDLRNQMQGHILAQTKISLPVKG